MFQVTMRLLYQLQNNEAVSHYVVLTLKVLVTTIDALGHFERGYLQYSGRGWGM